MPFTNSKRDATTERKESVCFQAAWTASSSLELGKVTQIPIPPLGPTTDPINLFIILTGRVD